MEQFEALKRGRVLPVLSLSDARYIKPLGDIFVKTGIAHVELTLRSAAALDILKEFSVLFPRISLGAGTVLDTDTAGAAAAAGARYIVSPGYSDRLADFCAEAGLPYVPTCVTGAEISHALEKGLYILKFFPSVTMGGAAALKLFAGPFPKVLFVPTGGIFTDNLADYASCKNILACGGSFMAPKALIEAEDWPQIEANCVRCLEIMRG